MYFSIRSDRIEARERAIHFSWHEKRSPSPHSNNNLKSLEKHANRSITILTCRLAPQHHSSNPHHFPLLPLNFDFKVFLLFSSKISQQARSRRIRNSQENGEYKWELQMQNWVQTKTVECHFFPTSAEQTRYYSWETWIVSHPYPLNRSFHVLLMMLQARGPLL